MPYKSPEARRLEKLIETITSYPLELLEAERPLLNIKWFDYRFLSPEQANKRFFRIYQEVYRRKFRAEIDMERADKVSGVHALTLSTDPRERTQLMAARQRADATGLPYELYVESAFDFLLRRGDHRKRFPRPNQLHGSPASAHLLIAFLKERYRDYLSFGLMKVEHPAYLISHYEGLPSQDDYRRFIFQHVLHEGMAWDRAIRTYVYDRAQVPLEVFKNACPPHNFDQAIASVTADLNRFPIQAQTSSEKHRAQVWPTCFGMHYTIDVSSPECSQCPLMAACQKVANVVLGQAAAITGVADPARDYQRRLTRNRQRKCRLRKAASEPNAEIGHKVGSLPT